MSKEPFGKVMAAMVTPFADDGSVNYAVAEKLAVHLIENGNDGLVICGTTGESPSLTWDEEHELFQVVKQAIGDRGKIIARHFRHGKIELKAEDKDLFSCKEWYLQKLKFERSHSGSITGLRLSNGRVMNLYFEKIK